MFSRLLAYLHTLIPPTTEFKDTALGDEDFKLPELVGPFPVHEPLTSAGSPHVHQ